MKICHAQPIFSLVCSMRWCEKRVSPLSILLRVSTGNCCLSNVSSWPTLERAALALIKDFLGIKMFVSLSGNFNTIKSETSLHHYYGVALNNKSYCFLNFIFILIWKGFAFGAPFQQWFVIFVYLLMTKAWLSPHLNIPARKKVINHVVVRLLHHTNQQYDK